MDGDIAAAKAHIDSLPEPRRSQMQHLHDVIVEAIPDADVTMFNYSGPLIGYRTYDYSNSRGDRTAAWFSVGLANRKGFLSLYSMAQRDGGYYVETLKRASAARRPAGAASTSPSPSSWTMTRCATSPARAGRSTRVASSGSNARPPERSRRAPPSVLRHPPRRAPSGRGCRPSRSAPRRAG